MTRTEYLNQRNGLMAEARQLLADGKSHEAAMKMDEVNTLDAKYAQEALDNANSNAMNGAARPAILENAAGATVVAGATLVPETNVQRDPLEAAASPEYRTAFFNYLRGVHLSNSEREAFECVNGTTISNAFTTTTESAAIPTQTLNEIWDLCKEQHSILADIDMRRTGVAIRVTKRTSITKGKGKKVGENTANDTMEDTKVEVELTGHDFSATVELSYASAKMSIDALESFIKRDIAEQIGNAMAADVVAQIEADMASGNKNTAASTSEVTYNEICDVFAQLKRCRKMVAYVSNYSLYKLLISMVGSDGHPVFQQNPQANAAGAILGAVIKLEDAVADGKILVGDPGRVLCNVVQDVLLESDRDIKTHTIIHSGYARAQSALMDDKSFASLALKTS
ncbi:MAG: phage major capsid protein [Monoglobaceae bacterium]